MIKKEGSSLMEQIHMVDFETGQKFLTPIEYPILRLPLRIQQQKLQKKMSVPKDNKHVDDLTGQPTTESKALRSRILRFRFSTLWACRRPWVSC